ncbi:Oligosaccaryltransferase [Niveomyces insectorum RCEF 264]|uniref:Dolichyl-diphosphooligosaccharide--protein glycosyltransferase subunit 4 n=1 Tax=Niveomyces insectorum RCEF 264 TaxID=1081102 RepID=A0A167Z925_9HYPO|nr:Oligosaccaryltransferase [Niveomyces insectorum RCEF 264]
MISDDQLYNLAIFLGCSAMILIVVYHFLETNTRDETESGKRNAAKAVAPSKGLREDHVSETGRKLRTPA